MRRFRCVRVVVVLGLAGALVGVVPDGVSAVATRARCRATAFVSNGQSASVSTIDVKTRTKHPDDINVGSAPRNLLAAATARFTADAHYPELDEARSMLVVPG